MLRINEHLLCIVFVYYYVFHTVAGVVSVSHDVLIDLHKYDNKL